MTGGPPPHATGLHHHKHAQQRGPGNDPRSGWLASEADLEIVAEVGVEVGFLDRVDELHSGR
jgi:hypothetical protein